MILKENDGRTADLKALRAMRSEYDSNARAKIVRELHNVETGLKGESTVAHYLRLKFCDDPDVLVVNDLRIAHGGDHAQIDHLVIDRISGTAWVVETKAYRGTMSCDRDGDWKVTYGNTVFPVDSPVHQARRHCVALIAWLDRMRTVLRSVDPVVLVSAETILERNGIPPDVAVMKSDAFIEWIAERRRQYDGVPRLSKDDAVLLVKAMVADHVPKPAENWPRRLGISRARIDASPTPQRLRDLSEMPERPLRSVYGRKIPKRGKKKAGIGEVIAMLCFFIFLAWLIPRMMPTMLGGYLKNPAVVAARTQMPQLGTPTSIQTTQETGTTATTIRSDADRQWIADVSKAGPRTLNGSFQRSIPLQGKIAEATFANRSPEDATILWSYDTKDGSGEHEALRINVNAGQSASLTIPAFGYRMAILTSTSARPLDLGYINLETPSSSLSSQPVIRWTGGESVKIQPGILAYQRR